MLKRIFGRFSKKSVVQPGADPSGNSPAPKSDPVVVYDAFGRELQITREDWRKSVLEPNLKSSWDDPESLYRFIISALNDGLIGDVEGAAARLLEIDPIPERSHTIRGIVLMKLGRLDEAEEILQVCIENVGETGTLLTNLAKVHAERGNHTQADALLWKAIQLDPNQDNGLLWWAAIHHERSGKAGYIQALEQAAALQGSWRPHLWLARHYLEHKDVASANRLYQQILAGGAYDSEALMMISGDLGNNGQVSLIPELIGPALDSRPLDPRAGINLLQAYLELGRHAEGELLLGRLYALDLAPFKQRLDQFSREFEQCRDHSQDRRVVEDPSQLSIETMVIDKPIWLYGLRDPAWLLAKKPMAAPRMTFLSFSKRSAANQPAEEQREDDIGRLTRAIPLYLAEAVYFWTPVGGSAFIPVVKQGGPIVFGSEHDGPALCSKLADQSTYLVTGSIDDSAERWCLSFSLWQCSNGSRLGGGTIETLLSDMGSAVLELERSLLALMKNAQDVPLCSYYTRPSGEAMGPYLTALGQSLMLTLAANEVVPAENLWGERTVLEWPLHMALEWPDSDVYKIMYLSGLGKAMDYQSPLLPEFKARTLQLLGDAQRTGSSAKHLTPLMWKAFGMTEELAQHRKIPSIHAPAEYRAWLERINAEDE